MDYKIKLTPQAILHIQQIVLYISKVLFAPKAAKNWSDHLNIKLNELETMPYRYSLLDEEPWNSRGLRRMFVKNYIVYYVVNEIEKIVYVIAVIYMKRDQLKSLTEL